jgi:proton-dependent oligopeptide transporter, POT family
MNINKNTSIFLLLAFVETWERFSYVGMRALLALYLTSVLNFSDNKTYAIFGLFAAIGYAVPVIAGVISDRLIGFQRTLIIGTVIMCIGHLLMFLSDKGEVYLYGGLGFIATGTGFFKGNIHNLLGLINSDKSSHQRDKIFSLFNISINLGSLFAAVTCGYTAHIAGWHFGFAIAGIGMLIGLIIFLKYRYILGNKGLLANNPIMNHKFLSLLYAVMISCVLSVFSVVLIYHSQTSLSYFSMFGVIIIVAMIRILIVTDKEQRHKLIFLLVLLSFLICFASIQMQLGSLINLFIERNADRLIYGHSIPSGVLQGVNALFVIMFGAMLANILAKYGYMFYMERFILGLFVNLLCFVVIYIGCVYAVNYKVNIMFLILSMALMSCAEVCLYPMLKVLFVTLSPIHIRGFMMGFFMFGMSYSNLASAIIAKFVSIPSTGSLNSSISLEIYKNGFLTISVFNALVLLLFLLIYPFLKRFIRKTYQ